MMFANFMKTFSCRTWLMLAAALSLGAAPLARATITVNSTSTFSNISIDPSSGSLMYLSAFESSAYAQSGPNSQNNTGISSTANASDVPVPGGSATGFGTASTSFPSGEANATGFIPDGVAGYDTSAGRASVNNLFEITGVSTPVSVTFSAVIAGELNLSSDLYGISGQAEDIFTLSVNGNPELFYDQPLSIGPSQSISTGYTNMLTATVTLMPNTQYTLWAEADAEAYVANGPQVVPEPSESALGACAVVSILAVYFIRRRQALKLRRVRKLFAMSGAITILALPVLPARARYLGSDAPDVCTTCGVQPTRQPAGGSSTSLSEGNLQVVYPVVSVMSGYGRTLTFALTYNSYNADGSKGQLDAGLGFGWTHTYNTVLFQQRGQMFRLGADGRVTQYIYDGGGNYTSDTGYFETMSQQPDGSFIVTNKNQSWWHYGSISNSFLVEGPTYRLLQMGDRNGNVTTMTYDTDGDLKTVTDEFGRTLQYMYNSSNVLSSVTDPLGRTTTFQYDALDRVITGITDPSGHTTTYDYNAEYQMTEKIDRDGRTYFYMYKDLQPFAVADSLGQSYFSMSNATDWAVNQTQLAYSMHRQYIPGTTESTDGNGHVWTYAYDTNGYITEVIAPDGSTTSYSYDADTRMLSSATDANGNTTRYYYDANGNRTNMTDALGEVTTYTYEPIFNQITSTTDPLGRTTIYQYDGNGNEIHEIDPLGETNSWTYDGHGNMLSSTDKRGYTTTYDYNAQGERTEMVDPLGNITKYAYDVVGNMIESTDPLGRATSYQYDALDRLIDTTNPLGGVTSQSYDASGNITNTTDPNTNVTRYVYDNRERLIEKIDALGGTVSDGYDPNNNRIVETNQLGHVTIYQYDTLNRPVETIDPLGGITRSTYDAVGNRISSTDPNTNTTHAAYDALNRVVDITNALGGVTTYDYSMPGGPPCCSPTPGSALITRLQDPDGNITFYHYDDLDRRVLTNRKNSDTNDVVNPGDAVTTTVYDPDNNVTGVTDPNGNTTLYSYDGDNRRISVINAAGDTTLTAYDGDGNAVMVTAPNLNIATNIYDALHRIDFTYDAIGLVRSNSYDAVGNPISLTDGLGHTAQAYYDGLNRRVEMIDPLGQPTITVYDADSNVSSVTDRNGHITQYAYDGLDRRVSTTDALGNTTTTGYDADGNVIRLTDANSHTTTYTYDSLNRRISETYPDPVPNTRTYSYDPAGNIIERTDQKGQVTTYGYNDLYYMTNRSYSPSGAQDRYTYDAAGRMLTATNRTGWGDTFVYDGANRLTNTAQNGQVLTYVYDIMDRVQTNTLPSGRVLNYAYDARNRLVSIGDGAVSMPIVDYVYDGADRVVTRTYRNHTSAVYTYNANNWVTTLDNSNATDTALIAGFNYAYDNEGNQLYEQRIDHSTGSKTYLYDGLNRITNYDEGMLSGSVIPSPNLARTWNLDPLGNWNTVSSNAVVDVRTHGPANELLTENGSNYVYDANGNIIQDNIYNYSYDEENRLTQIQRRAGLAIVGQYIYDALSRRVNIVASPAFVGTTNRYFYDGGRIVEERKSNGPNVITYVYGNYVDEVLTMSQSLLGQTYYYHPNALWSVQALTDQTGAVEERYTYDAYGAVTVLDATFTPQAMNAWGTPHSPVLNKFLFTGRELDEESGLYFYRARHYDANKGRFLERDPLEYQDSMNLYQYVGDNPANQLDPMGLETVRSWFRWYYWSRFGNDYLLAYLKVEANYQCADGDVNVTRSPTLTLQEVNYGVAGPIGNPTVVPYTCRGGGRGFTVSYSLLSSYSASGFWSTVGTYAGAGAGGGALVGGAVTWYTGPGVLVGAGGGGAIGGAGGFIVGVGAYLWDFSSWNSPISLNYTVCCCSCGRRVHTLNESAAIPATGNSDVAAVGSMDVFWCNKQAIWIWGRNISAADLATGSPAVWLGANIAPRHGFNGPIQVATKPR